MRTLLILSCVAALACGDDDVAPDGGTRDASLDSRVPEAGSDSGRDDDGGSDADRDTSGDTATDAPVDAGIRTFSTDRDEFFGEPRCASLGALFCDDFEDDAVGSDPDGWIMDEIGGGAVEVTDEDAARGSRALRITTDGDFSRGWARQESIFPRETFYGRLLFRVVAPGPQEFVHWDMVEPTGHLMPGGPLQRMRIGGVSLRNESDTDFIFNRFFFNFEQSPRPDGFDEFTEPEAEGAERLSWGEWHCVEFYYDAPEDTTVMWYDGTERVRFERTVARGDGMGRTADFPTFEGVNLGWTIYQAIGRPFTVYVDEVALDDERIGCSL